MYETGNAVPSAALEDMADNAQTLDALVIKTEGTTTDRLGRTRRVFQQILMDMGFQPLSGSFQSGATVTARNQALYDEVSKVFYAWGGAIPVGGYVVPAGSTPATAGGTGIGAWSDKTDLTLRAEIIDFIPDGVNHVVTLHGNSIKTYKWLDGVRDRGAVASFSNLNTPDSAEPVTQVLNLPNAAALAGYPDRDFVCLYGQVEGPAALQVTSATVFTTNTISISDLTDDSLEYLRAGQIIDVIDGSNRYSSFITSIAGNVISVEGGWYLVGGGTTGVPTNGATAKLVPNTKVWSVNTNVALTATSDATDMTGYELGVINNKGGQIGTGFDVVTLGTYPGVIAYRARGSFEIGYQATAGKAFGFVSEAAGQIAFYSNQSINTAMQADGGVHGSVYKGVTGYPLLVKTSADSFLTGINSSGAVEGRRLSFIGTAIGDTISNYASVTYAAPTVNLDSINLPAPADGRCITVKNSSQAFTLLVVGPMDDAAGGFILNPLGARTVIGNGSLWFTI